MIRLYDIQLFRSYSFFFFGMLALLASGCLNSSSDQNGSVREVTDMLGRRVEIPVQVDSVIGVGPGALRLLVYMDVVDRVSGIEDVELRPGRPYTFAHPELVEKPVIGPYMGGDSELIAMNQPDVIFMGFSTASDADDLQNRSGIPVIGLNSGNLGNARDTLFQAFDLIGEVTERTARADSLKKFIRTEIEKLDRLTGDVDAESRPSAYVGAVSYRGAHGISSTEAFYAPFRFINAINVAGDLKEKEPVNPTGTYVDIENIIRWDPDYLFIDAAGATQAFPYIQDGEPLARTLSAIKNDNVYTLMPHNWYATNFENVLANAWFAGTVMYPELFKEFDAEEKARQIYRFMLGRDVYDEMKSTYDGWNQL
ncbi:MAG: ABC transporter substrate-binding protein [Marinilabiliaceae bacterium]